ncbi:MAG: hypothetical protein HRU41_16615 [Saprospiraceae bacterium]|nr:hypothetical protein [Saprospiraceae bacterium]
MNKNRKTLSANYLLTLTLSGIFFFAFTPILPAQRTANQEITLAALIKEHSKKFQYSAGRFVGEGWTEIREESKKSKHVLIGEDHFFNEIPLFVSKIAEANSFDNFFCEIDPISAKLIEKQLKTASETALRSYIEKYGSTFSFFALHPEMEMLKQLVAADTKVFGTDQVVLMADRLISASLEEVTKSESAREIYQFIEKESKLKFEQFTAGKGEPYFFTDSFTNQLQALDTLDLSDTEKVGIKAMKLSRKIYMENNHQLRIQLMKHNLMQEMDRILNGKNLYKYGAIHAGKGESLLGGFDIGNVVHNLAESQFESSLHIMIIGKDGMQGGSFKGDPAKKLDPNQGPLKALQPFFETVEGDKDWYVFNTAEILQAAKKQKLQLENRTLKTLVSNYDYLVIIPTVTAASFIY